LLLVIILFKLFVIILFKNLFTDHIFAYSLLQHAKKEAKKKVQIAEVETGKKFILLNWLKRCYL